ncbi:hypothetical protein HN011_011646, partial [Eciton burchellii]
QIKSFQILLPMFQGHRCIAENPSYRDSSPVRNIWTSACPRHKLGLRAPPSSCVSSPSGNTIVPSTGRGLIRKEDRSTKGI